MADAMEEDDLDVSGAKDDVEDEDEDSTEENSESADAVAAAGAKATAAAFDAAELAEAEEFASKSVEELRTMVLDLKRLHRDVQVQIAHT